MTFSRLREVVGLVGLGSVLSCAASAFVGAAVVSLAAGAPFWLTWQTWWIADGVGMLVIAPLILSWTFWLKGLQFPTLARVVEGSGLSALLIVMGVLVFSSREADIFARPSYVILPLLVWAAVRFGPRGVSIASLVLATVAVWYTTRGLGPFVSPTTSTREEVLGLQLFLSVTTFSYLALAAVMAERKLAQEQLQFQKTLLESQSEAAADGIIIVSGAKKWLSYNRRFLDMWGMPEHIIQRRDSAAALGYVKDKVVDPEGFLAQINHLYDHPDQEDWAEVELKDGRVFDRYTAPVKSSRGVYYGRVWYYRDITERKRAEAEQAQLLQDLASANRELNDFAYVVSHDLKAPLRAIGLLADWLAVDYADRLGEEGQRQLKLLVGRVKRMNTLIDGILEYSRVGRSREQQAEIDLNSLVAEVIDLIAPPPHIRMKVENHLPVVKGEKTRLQQLFQNLLSNAIKFMDKPQGEVKIGCIDDNGDWQFYVVDNGPGIEDKYFSKIFQLFQILSPRDEMESTGVGLALVKRIVELHGGRVWVESRVGEGASFFFTLPQSKKVIAEESGRLR
jgi:PAS domain S-box-containing protein